MSSGSEGAPTQPENVVLVGKKSVMSYVTACMTVFNAGSQQIVVKARGRAIGRAIDVVELLRRVFVKDLEIKKIDLGTEEMTQPDGRKSYVSTIELTLARSPRS